MKFLFEWPKSTFPLSFSKPLHITPRKPKSVMFANSSTVQGLFNWSDTTAPETKATPTSSVTLTQTRSKVHQNIVLAQLVDLVDLCNELCKQNQNATKCCGYISDLTASHQHRFGVYPVESCNDCDGWSTVSLHNLLISGTFRDQRAGPKLPQQLNIAATVASSVLQLHDTPWMPKILASNNIYFMRRNEVLSYDQVYMAKRLPDSVGLSCQDHNEYNSRDIKNPTVFSVGVLLIELILCETLEDLCPPDDLTSKLPSPLLRSSALQRISI